MVSGKTPRERYNSVRERLKRRFEDGEISRRDYERLTEFLDAYDSEVFQGDLPSDDSHKQASTLRNYARNLQQVSIRLDTSIPRVDDDVTELVNVTTDDINGYMTALLSGEHPCAKDSGLTKGTVKQKQGILRKFFRYHDDLGVDPESIEMIGQLETKVTDDDVLTEDEIHDLMDNAPNLRDRALVAILAYTGQRHGAIRTLRIKDVLIGPGSRHFQLNPEADILKGASGRRPLLGAKKPLKDWIEHGHPCPDDPEAAVFTPLDSYSRDELLGERLGQSTFNNRLKVTAREAGIDEERVYPHVLRHTFVTICVRQYDLDDQTIKRLIGHDDGSRVMETTYSHLTDEDAIDAIEVAHGIQEEDEESSLSPETCYVCHEPLRPDAKACPNCGEVYTPDGKAVQDEMQADLVDTATEVDTELEKRGVESLRKLLQDDPELLAEALERRSTSKGDSP